MKRNIVKLYLDFLKFGCFTFGGGWSIIAQMQKQYCEKEALLEEAELLDLAGTGNSLPGTMISNVAMLFGYRLAGVAGGLSCLLGMITAPVLVIIIITVGYENYIDVPLVNSVMTGVRASVVPIILCSVAKMVKSAFKNVFCVIIAAAVFVMQYFLHINPVITILFGIVCGLIMSYMPIGKEKDDAA